ncbi:KxYKxGKxW signal peptide domain-containing protein, partial [Weissella confusa]
MRQMNINKGNYEVKSHYKMYKAGKRWVVAGMATVTLLGGLLMLSTDASADNVDAVVPASESSVTAEVSAPTDSVVLDNASASVAPASSVSAEVSASSASSVAPVSVSTVASVVSAEVSLSASQSLASSVVVPAEAVKTAEGVDSDENRYQAYVLGEAAQTADAKDQTTEIKNINNVTTTDAGTNAAFNYQSSAGVTPVFNQTGDIANLSSVAGTDYLSNYAKSQIASFERSMASSLNTSVSVNFENQYATAITSFSNSVRNSMSDAIKQSATTSSAFGESMVASAQTSIAYSLLGLKSDDTILTYMTRNDVYFKQIINDVKTQYDTLVAASAADLANVTTRSATISTINAKVYDSLNVQLGNYKSNDASYITYYYAKSAAYTFESTWTTDNGAILSSAIAKQNGNSINFLKTSDGKGTLTADQIDWQALTPQYKNEGGTLTYERQLDISNAFSVAGAYKLLDIDNSGTTSTEQAMKNWNTGYPGVYNGGQAVGLVLADTTPDLMGTAGLNTGNSLNTNDGISGIRNAVITGRDLFVVANNRDVKEYSVHIRTSNDKGELFGMDTVTNPKKTTGTLDNNQPGYAYSTDIPTVNGSSVSSTTDVVQKILRNGVTFTYDWLPDTDQSGVPEGSVRGTITYTEKSLVTGDNLGTVSNKVTLKRFMSIGLYGANGGNGQSFYGGITSFNGYNSTGTVNVKYQFKNDVSQKMEITGSNKVVDKDGNVTYEQKTGMSTIDGVVGETIQILRTATDQVQGGANAYLAPNVPGFKVSDDSTLVATVKNGANLTITYTVDKDGFQKNAKSASQLAGTITDQIKAVKAKMANAPEKDKAVIQIAINKMQSELDKLQGTDGISGIIAILNDKTSDSTLDGLSKVDDVVTNYNNVQSMMTDVDAIRENVDEFVGAVGALLDKDSADADAARNAAKLLGDAADSTVTSADKQYTNKVQQDQANLQAVMKDLSKSATDIEHATAVLLADVESESVEHGTDGNVQELLKKVEQAVANGTTDEINEATAKLKIADATVVPANIADDTDVAAAKTAVDTALAATTLNQTQLNDAKATYDKAVEQADNKLGTAKSGANDDTAAWEKIASLYADQTDKIGAIQADIDELNGMTAEGNTTAKKSDIEAA